MSIQALAWVLEQSESEFVDRLVLLAIANHADSAGWVAFPSVRLIAAEARVSRATVFRSLLRLRELGELEVANGGRGRGNRNSYRILGSQAETLKRDFRVSQTPVKGLNSSSLGSHWCDTEPSVTVKEPSRGRAREARPPTDPDGAGGLGKSVPEWTGGEPDCQACGDSGWVETNRGTVAACRCVDGPPVTGPPDDPSDDTAPRAPLVDLVARMRAKTGTG